MATVSVTATNNQVDDAEVITGVTSIGGGAGASAEGAFFYQGALLWNRKVTSSTGAGFYYNPASDSKTAEDMTVDANKTLMIKAIVTDYAGLQVVDGLQIRIGSGTSAYHAYIIAGSNAKINSLLTYPARGGFIVIPIDPNVSAYRDGALGAGSPVLTAVDYFGIVAEFATASAKSENVGLDALDLAVALTLIGGDGADPDGVWQDFVDFDEGTIANRIGLASSTFDSIKLFFGHQIIGGVTATVFSDIISQVLWPDGLFAKGWSAGIIDISHSGTDITDGANHTGLGSITLEDTRPDYKVIGNRGVNTFSGFLNNFGEVDFQPSSTVIGAIIEAVILRWNASAFSDSTIITKSASAVATMTDIADIDHYHEDRGNNSLVTRLDGAYRRGQSFNAGKTGILKSAKFWLDRSGSPTGNATAKLYAHSGTFGTTSVPTGTALATSATVDISTITVKTGTGKIGKEEVEFVFSDDYELVSGTNYVIVFELDGAGSSDASNYIAFLADNVDTLHDGNFVTYNGSWNSDATREGIFHVEIATQITISDTVITQGNAGHAIELTEPVDQTFVGHKYVGYGGTIGSNLVASSGANDAVIYNNSGGAITVTVTGGGDSPSVRNGVGATTTVIDAKTFKFTINPSFTGYEWRVYEVTAVGSLAGAVEVDGEEVSTADNQTYSYEYSVDQPIAIQIIALVADKEESIEYFTLTATSQDVTINLDKDHNN